jgi:hypothetical protein
MNVITETPSSVLTFLESPLKGFVGARCCSGKKAPSGEARPQEDSLVWRPSTIILRARRAPRELAASDDPFGSMAGFRGATFETSRRLSKPLNFRPQIAVANILASVDEHEEFYEKPKG